MSRPVVVGIAAVVAAVVFAALLLSEPPPDPIRAGQPAPTFELARLDGIWGSGDAWAGRNRQKLDEFRQHRDAQWDAETAAHEAMLAELQASEARRLSPAPAAADMPPALEDRSAAAYDRLWKLPPPAAPAAEVPPPASGSNHAAAESCSDGPERNLDLDVAAARLKRAYAPPRELAMPPVEQPRRVPPSDRQKTFRRERLQWRVGVDATRGFGGANKLGNGRSTACSGRGHE